MPDATTRVMHHTDGIPMQIHEFRMVSLELLRQFERISHYEQCPQCGCRPPGTVIMQSIPPSQGVPSALLLPPLPL